MKRRTKMKAKTFRFFNFLIVIATVLMIAAGYAKDCKANEWFSPMSKDDIIRQASLGILIYIDNRQTKNAMDNGYYELNPLMGKHPSHQDIDRYSIGAFVLHSILIWSLPKYVREITQYIILGAEGDTIIRNEWVGARFKVRF